jgi:hypothetical protein
MTIYFNIKTKEYPRHDGDLELLGWSLGNPLPEDWVKVEYANPPVIDSNTTYETQPPTLVNGVWKITYTTRPLTDVEKVRRDTPMPEDGKLYTWDTLTASWKEVK